MEINGISQEEALKIENYTKELMELREKTRDLRSEMPEPIEIKKYSMQDKGQWDRIEKKLDSLERKLDTIFGDYILMDGKFTKITI